MEKIRIMIVDDIDKLVEFFEKIISAEDDMEVVGTASSGKEAVEKVELLKPDIVLMDIQMETDEAGIEATEKIKEKNPDIKIIMLTIHDDADIIFNSYVAGAMDFLLKNSSVVKIIKSIRDVHANSLQMRAEVAEKILGEMTRLKTENNSMLYMTNLISKLTNTEVQILKLVYSGYKYKQIAAMRSIEEATVRTHINHILTKLEFKNMKEVIKTLESLGIMEYFKNI